MMYVVAMALGSQLALAADRVPRFDTATSCRSAAAASVMTGRTTQNCLGDEKNAHKLLEKSWNRYSAADKSDCDTLERTGGPASYVELLSCLEMSRDARLMAKDNGKSRPNSATATPAQTTGAGSPMKELPVGSGPAVPPNKP